MLRGASSQVLEEAERSLHDALCVLLTTVKSPYTICGGGASEVISLCSYLRSFRLTEICESTDGNGIGVR